MAKRYSWKKEGKEKPEKGKAKVKSQRKLKRQNQKIEEAEEEKEVEPEVAEMQERNCRRSLSSRRRSKPEEVAQKNHL